MTQAFGARIVRSAAMVAGAAVLAACSDYEVKFNERPIYTPKPLFTDFSIRDDALRTCVQQTIKDERISAADDLTVLVCSNAGIVSLAGIQAFAGIEQLNLASNEIEDIQPLRRLSQLRRADLSDNALTTVEPLVGLALLQQVNLQGNPALDCRSLAQLKVSVDLQLNAPEHCDEL